VSLNITNTANTFVDKCSGGQQKRIAIALELTAEDKPNLLCIDEPTSGLDSCAAEELISFLKELTDNNCLSVVTSIHQPSADILKQFDRLYVMAKRGICVFNGSPHHIVDHLLRCEIELDEEEVPIEVLIKLSSVAGSQVIERMSQMVRNECSELEEICLQDCILSDRGVSLRSVTFSLIQTWYLLCRTITYNMKQRLRSDLVLAMFTLLIAFVIPFTFIGHTSRPIGCIDPIHPPLCNQSAQDLADNDLMNQNDGLIALTIIIFNALVFIPSSMIFAEELMIFVREHNNRWYSTGMFTSNLNYEN
jgi:hypothetical protein